MPKLELSPYNLPGFGLIRPVLFPHAAAVFDYLERAGLISRLEDIDQLGVIRKVFPGAHHTRLEYVMAQLALVTELCLVGGHSEHGIRLSSNARDFPSIQSVGGQPSYGEILQIAVLMANVGHLPYTFSSERAFCAYLKSDANSDLLGSFRLSLAREVRQHFDRTLRESSTYRFHLFLASFLVDRFTRFPNGQEAAALCQKVLCSYLGSQHPLLWHYYRTIRRITFLALDSLYTPVPFSVDLNSLFLSIRHDGARALGPENVLGNALNGLESVMRDSVYLSPQVLLQHSRVSECVLAYLQELEIKPGIRAFSELILNDLSLERLRPHVEAKPAAKTQADNSVALGYRIARQRSEELLGVVHSLFWEQKLSKRIGRTLCRFGCEWDPTGRHLRLVAGLRDIDHVNAARIGLQIARGLMELHEAVAMKSNMGLDARWKQESQLLRFLCRAIFGFHRKIRSKPHALSTSRGVIVSMGVRRAQVELKSTIDHDEGFQSLDADFQHEIKVTESALGKLAFKGRVVVFFGSIEILRTDKQIAELDGLIVQLPTSNSPGVVHIVEAKNMPRGHTAARTAIRKKLKALGMYFDEESLHDIDRSGAMYTMEV